MGGAQELRQRRAASDEGFTLIELMVVVLIIAILMAIAIPTFISAQQRAAEKRSQAALRNALTNARTITTDLGAYAFEVGSAENPISATEMFKADNAYSYSDNPADASATVMVVAVDVAPDDPLRPNSRIHLFMSSKPGRWFGLVSTTRGAVRYCQGMDISFVQDADACDDPKW